MLTDPQEDTDLEGTDPQGNADLEGTNPQEYADLEGTGPQGNADLEGTVYPRHDAFFPTPEHFLQLPTYAGHQLSQGPHQGLVLGICTQAGIHGWLQRAR